MRVLVLAENQDVNKALDAIALLRSKFSPRDHHPNCSTGKVEGCDCYARHKYDKDAHGALDLLLTVVLRVNDEAG